MPQRATDARARLLEIVRSESLRFGEFVLSSGARSDHYVDLRRTTTHPEGALLVARLLLDRLRPLELDAVGGPTLGADPILGALAALSHLDAADLPVFIVRKSGKTHGMQNLIEGRLERGWRVAILDDTVTGGGSILEAVRTARAAGADVRIALTIVDRNQGGREALAREGLELDAIYDIREVLDAPRGREE